MGGIETLPQSQAVTAATLRRLVLNAPCLGSRGGVCHLCYSGGADAFSTAWYSLPPGFPCPPRTLFTKDLCKSMKKGLLLSLQGASYHFEILSMLRHLFKCKTVFRKVRRGAFLVECSYLAYLNFKELSYIHMVKSHSSPVCSLLSVL